MNDEPKRSCISVEQLRRAKAILSARAELDKINRRIDADILEVFHQHWLSEIFAQWRARSLAGNPFA